MATPTTEITEKLSEDVNAVSNIVYEDLLADLMKIREIWTLLGLDYNKPLMLRKTQRNVDGIIQNIETTPTSVKIQRQA
jgi:hypothetical protein